MTQFKMLVGGNLVEAASGLRGTSFNPGSGEPAGTFPMGGQEDLAAAVGAARQAFDSGPWPRFSPTERAIRVMELADAMLGAMPRLARLEAQDSGGLIGRTTSDVLMAARHMRRLARLACTSFPWREDVPPGSPLFPSRNQVVREPMGVCAGIIPWNFPLLMAVWKITMATLAGNTLVLKPAPDTPLSALALGELAAASRIPPGVINIITGPGRELGEALVRHPSIDRVAFTGSGSVGRQVAIAAADGLKRVSLELGGKSANVILEDADLDLAMDGALFACFLHAGQVCNAGTRLLIPERMRSTILDELARRARNIRVGDQMDPRTQMGPLLNALDLFNIASFVMIFLAARHTMRLKTSGAVACAVLGILLTVGLQVIFAK